MDNVPLQSEIIMGWHTMRDLKAWGGGGHSGTEGGGGGGALRKKGSLRPPHVRNFCKRRVLFCTKVRSMGVKIPLQSTKYTRL